MAKLRRGALQPIEAAIAAHGSASYLEIGPGHCLFASALAQCFDGQLRVFLIDLTATSAGKEVKDRLSIRVTP